MSANAIRTDIQFHDQSCSNSFKSYHVPPILSHKSITIKEKVAGCRLDIDCDPRWHLGPWWDLCICVRNGADGTAWCAFNDLLAGRDRWYTQSRWERTCELNPLGILSPWTQREMGLSFFAVSPYQGNGAYLNEGTAPPTPAQDEPLLSKQATSTVLLWGNVLICALLCFPCFVLQWEAGQLPHPSMMRRSETSSFCFPNYSPSCESVFYCLIGNSLFLYCASVGWMYHSGDTEWRWVSTWVWPEADRWHFLFFT